MSSPLDKHVEAVSGVISDWLVAEVASSSGDRNQYLDDYAQWQKQIRLGYDDDRNWTAAKNRAHLDRLPIWWQAYELEPLNDEVCAKISFAGLMFISGAFRNQSYFQAHDAEDYRHRRSAGIGINLQNAVSTRLYTHLPNTGNLAKARITLEDLNDRRQQAEKVGEQSVRVVCSRAAIGYDIGEEHSRSVREMQASQYAWATFITDCIALAAKQRGGELASVPLLYPINISDNPGVMYPFAEAA